MKFIKTSATSLISNIPLTESMDIALDLILCQPNPCTYQAWPETIFSHCRIPNTFLFNGLLYDQPDEVAMGCPLVSQLANLFMGYHEQSWIANYDGPNVSFYRRYVDGTFCVFNNVTGALSFFDYLNIQRKNIKFTLKKEQDNNTCTTSIFHKNPIPRLFY